SDKPKGIRGFGGRLYFYGKDPNKPVKVKGSLVVYAFDETNRDPKNVIPDKKYVFTPEQFQRKYSKSTLGDSYSVWLPWDEVGGMQKQVSLVARFSSEKGSMITSDEAHQLLPGVTPDKKIAAADPSILTVAGQSVALPAVPPMLFGTNQVAASGVQPVAYPAALDATGSAPKTFSVMQASTGAAVLQAPGAQSPAQNLVQESYGPDPTMQHMRTTTISVPQVPRPRFSSPNLEADAAGMNMQSAGFNSGVQSQMAGFNQQYLQNQAMQNQIPAQIQQPMQMQQAMQGPAMNQRQLFPSAQMQMQRAPVQNQNFIGQNGAANFTAPTALAQAAPAMAMAGAMNPMAMNQMALNRTAMNSATSTGPAAPGATGPVASGATVTANAARSEFDKLRVLGAPIARLDSDRGQWPQSRAELPSSLPFAPQSGQPQ
ncbi:MAG TPA: hypothetical protein VGI75_06200, partial [Pirellulales bacterium]